MEKKKRAPKTKPSTPSRKRMNQNKAIQTLAALLAANFVPGDLLITLTYDPDCEGIDRPTAIKYLRAFLRSFRGVRNKRRKNLLYLHSTLSPGIGERVQHQVVLNAAGTDLEELQSLWRYGEVEAEVFEPGIDYAALAKRLTSGIHEANANSWVPSYSLVRPPDSTPRGIYPEAGVGDRW